MLRIYNRKNLIYFCMKTKNYSTEVSEQRLKQCFNILKIPPTADSVSIRCAYLKLVKKYHPDSGTTDANKDKFCDLQDAFKILSKELIRRGSIHYKVVEENPWLSLRHVWENSNEDLIKKRGLIIKKFDFESKEDLEKSNHNRVTDVKLKLYLHNVVKSGTLIHGPNYSVNCPKHKLNEVLVDNGFSPTMTSLHKSIISEIDKISREMSDKRAKLGPIPLTSFEQQIWEKLVAEYKQKATDLMIKISIYNLILPLANKPLLVFDYSDICIDILQRGNFEGRYPLVINSDDKTEDKLEKLELIVKFVIRTFVKIKEIYARGR